MPRLDNSNPEVIDWFELEFDEDDPGETDPVDLCSDCSDDLFGEDFEIDHPPYEDMGGYTCAECGCALTKEDD